MATRRKAAPHERSLQATVTTNRAPGGVIEQLSHRLRHRVRVGVDRSGVSFFRHLAAGHQYRHDIVTFLMVFLIQSSQNRDAVAMHLKLDELLRAVDGARTGLVNLESLSDAELLGLHHEFEKLQAKFGLEAGNAVAPEHLHRELASRGKAVPHAKKH